MLSLFLPRDHNIHSKHENTTPTLGATVHEPFEGAIQKTNALTCHLYIDILFKDTGEGAKTATEQGPGWAYRVAQADVQV